MQKITVFYLVASEVYEPDLVIGIFSTVEKAREIYDAEMAAPYGKRKWWGRELDCYAVELDSTEGPQAWVQVVW